jgi:UDP-N-acetylmuramoyl-tripeptide--D-alanyl-D-alanine ligase
VDIPVVGITGSVGKTSAKDMAKAVLARSGPVHSSPQSFNNEIGVPLTLLNTPDDVAALVLELGARREGDIASLCGIARPDIGVITTVAAVHTGVMGSVDVVARTKGELLDGLPAGGCAVLNADVPEVMTQAVRTRARQITFGAAGEVRALARSVDDHLQVSFLLESPWGRTDVHLGVPGVHMVDNALAAAAVGLVLDVPLEEVAVGLSEARLSPGRMQMETAPSGMLVVNDAYNASPTSVEAALRTVSSLPDTGRKVAVLGLMAELGEESNDAHQHVVAIARELGVEVFAVGTDLYGIESLEGIDEAFEAVVGLGLGDGDSVLVKGSLVAGLQELAERLSAL